MNAFTALLGKFSWNNREIAETEKISATGKAERQGFSERMRRLLKMGKEFEHVPDEDVLTAILQSDLQNLRGTLEEIDKNAFQMSVNMILNASNIYIVGIRSCEPLAGFLGFYMNMMFDNVKLLQTNSASEILEQMLRIDSKDVLIGISFPRYSMRTLKAMEFANQRSANVIAITDSIHSPMNLYSSCNLIAHSDMASVVDSLTAPLSIVNALIAALCLRRQNEVTKYLDTLDQVWEEYQIYDGDELNPVNDHIEIWQAQKEKETVHE